MMKLWAALIAVSLVAATFQTAQAQLFWDVNSTNAGSSDTGDATGTWNSTNTNWTTDGANGTATPGIWDSTNTPVAEFSAAGGATGSSYTVHVADAESTNGLTFDDTLVTVDSTGGTLTLAGATPAINIPGAGNQATISAPLAGANGFTYTGGNSLTTLVLSGANTYSGSTSIISGTLSTGASDVIPDTSVLLLGSATTFGTFKLNGNTETIKAFGSAISNSAPGGKGLMNLGTGTLTLQDDGETRYFFPTTNGSALIGTGKLIKNGTGSLTFDGSTNDSTTFDGEIVLNNGTLQFKQQNNLGSTTHFGATLTLNGGTLQRSASTLVFKNLNIGGDTTIDLTGTGDFQINGGSDVANGTSVTLKTSPQITVNPVTGSNPNAGAWLLRGPIGDDGNGFGFTKLGDGVMRLSSDVSTYTGPVTIKAGFLTLTNPAGGSAVSAKIGNGTGRVNLSGGGLATSAPASAVSGVRQGIVDNPVNVTKSSTISWMPAASFATTTDINFDFIFTNNNFTLDADNTGACPTSSSCVLTFRNDALNGSNTNNKVYRPTMQGNFTYNGDVALLNYNGAVQGGVANTTRVTQLVSSNTGTQTWGGSVSGDAAFRRAATGTTVFTGNVSLLYAGTSTNLTTGTTMTIDSTGTLSIGNGGATGAITSAANIANSGSLVFNRTGSSAFSGAISGTGTVAVMGGGTLSLSAATSNYSGGTTLSGSGTKLLADGGLTGAGAIAVGGGTTLGGIGSVSGVVTNNGTLAPGDTGVGTLTATTNVTDGANSHWAIDLNGASADKLVVGGNLNLAAVDSLDVTAVGSGSSWVIATYAGSLTGTFDSLNIPAGYTINYGTGTNSQITLNGVGCAPGDLNCDGHVDARDYVFWRKTNGPAGDYTAWRANFGVPPGAGSSGGLSGGAAVPEPGTLSLFICALGSGLIASSRRRRSCCRS